jgi:hypothetical protein
MSSSKGGVQGRSADRGLAAPDRPHPLALTVAGWLVPGAAHALAGQLSKAVIFFITLTFMFVVGIAAGGRLFPFVPSDPLIFLAAGAEWALGLPRIVAALGGFGEGNVVTATYEYGNTFLIVAGLLNALVLFDAYDAAMGHRPS